LGIVLDVKFACDDIAWFLADGVLNIALKKQDSMIKI
jgi:hypothetical protein